MPPREPLSSSACPWVPTATYRPIMQHDGIWLWWDYESKRWLPETLPGHTVYRLQRELAGAVARDHNRLTRPRIQ